MLTFSRVVGERLSACPLLAVATPNLLHPAHTRSLALAKLLRPVDMRVWAASMLLYKAWAQNQGPVLDHVRAYPSSC